MILPSLSTAVKAVSIPQIVKDKQVDAALDAAASADLSELNAAAIQGARVHEVLENGGFLSRPRTIRAAKAGVDVYEYQRLSRDGQPLEGAEAKKPPVYILTAWGTLGLSCTCPWSRKNKAICKHSVALTRALLGLSMAPKNGGR